jgi:hypothetical protein
VVAECERADHLVLERRQNVDDADLPCLLRGRKEGLAPLLALGALMRRVAGGEGVSVKSAQPETGDSKPHALDVVDDRVNDELCEGERLASVSSGTEQSTAA